jgi:hypothetical protein
MSIVKQGLLALSAGGIAAALLIAGNGLFRADADAATDAAAVAAPVTLKPASDFAKIESNEARAVALFEEAGKVIQSPRCLNCHPATERPTQTDRMRPHQPLVVRGEGGMGASGGLSCDTCHHADNFDAAGVPGNPQWHLAPEEMAWQGKTLGQICIQIKDKNRNGGREITDLVKHMSEDGLVGWAWSPGKGRTAAPGTQAEFGALIAAWVAAGASCPKT